MTRLVAHFDLSRKEIPYIMADVCDKDLYDLKILEAVDYIKHVSKKKPTKARILKFMARSNLKLLEEVLQMLLDNLEEEGIVENLGVDSSQCFYLKESIESYTKRRPKATEIADSREDDTQDAYTVAKSKHLW